MHRRTYGPTDSGGALLVSGRYHRAPDQFPRSEVWVALYLALSPEVSLGEVVRHFAPQLLPQLNEYRLSEIDVALEAVLDCRDAAALGLSPEDLTCDYDFAMTQEVGMLEEIVDWCRTNPELEAARREARSHFFGEDELPVEYWPGTGDLISKERRFLGYFLFNWELPSGEHPVSESAVKRLYQGDVQAEALTAVRGARFVFAFATGITGRSVYLELEKERFEVRSAQWAANLHRGLVVVAHLLPVRHGYWLPGPGWAELPFTLGDGMRGNLAEMQIDPITFERMLQHRSCPPDEEPRPEPPRDDDLDAAVARMTH
ncbi:MAG TPA: hypothetical protein VMR52_13235 [Dehalococcoidia bacterium]|nr:hypothetical protein [Dehalococcoidia bacterium]